MSEILKGEPPDRSASSSPTWWRTLDTFAVLAMLPTVLAGTARWWWIGDLCVHFRGPYVIATAILAIVYLSLRRWKWLTAICVVLIVNVALILPLFAVRHASPATGASMRVMVANVHIKNSHSQPILECVRDEEPDVLILIEVDYRWLSDLAELNATYPYTTDVIRGEESGSLGPFGMAIFSRFPLSNTRTLWLGTSRPPTLVTTVTQDENDWTLIAAHPYPPVSPMFSEARNSLLTELAYVISGLEGPKVLVGDLNITRWSPHFIDLLRVSGLDDSAIGFGYQPTWPAVPVIPIDHILVSPEVAVLTRHVGASIASDHRPVIADVAVRKSNEHITD